MDEDSMPLIGGTVGVHQKAIGRKHVFHKGNLYTYLALWCLEWHHCSFYY